LLDGLDLQDRSGAADRVESRRPGYASGFPPRPAPFGCGDHSRRQPGRHRVPIPPARQPTADYAKRPSAPSTRPSTYDRATTISHAVQKSWTRRHAARTPTRAHSLARPLAS
jgi:hypothetical protein